MWAVDTAIRARARLRAYCIEARPAARRDITQSAGLDDKQQPADYSLFVSMKEVGIVNGGW
jgi:hypothetical protein